MGVCARAGARARACMCMCVCVCVYVCACVCVCVRACVFLHALVRFDHNIPTAIGSCRHRNPHRCQTGLIPMNGSRAKD